MPQKNNKQPAARERLRKLPERLIVMHRSQTLHTRSQSIRVSMTPHNLQLCDRQPKQLMTLLNLFVTSLQDVFLIMMKNILQTQLLFPRLPILVGFPVRGIISL